MFVRIRWFVAGVAATLGGVGYLANQLRQARLRLTPSNLATAAKRQVADWIDGVATRIGSEETGRGPQ